MFTGIVEETGEVLKVEDTADGGRMLWLRASCLAERAIGASVAVDGVCLTVAERDRDTCRFDLSPETLSRSTLGSKEPGGSVNLELPLRAGDELGGHIVQGHVDAVGEVTEVNGGTDHRMRVRTPPAVTRYLVEKGSVTVDGVSLTIARLSEDGFEVALVPHTLEVTTLGGAHQGRAVNLEVDVVAKYVERLVRPHEAPTAGPEGPEIDSGYL
jgi:riboflavin synthase